MKFILSIVLALLLNGLQHSFCQSRLMKSIYFEKGSSKVNKKYTTLLKGLADKIRSDSCSIIRIIGYADPTGSKDYNEYISENRANAVYHSLLSYVKIDITKIRVHIESNGDSDEWYDLHLKGAHIRQRCVDIVLEFVEPGTP